MPREEPFGIVKLGERGRSFIGLPGGVFEGEKVVFDNAFFLRVVDEIIDLLVVEIVNVSECFLRELHGAVCAHEAHVVVAKLYFAEVPFHVVAVGEKFVVVKECVVLGVYGQEADSDAVCSVVGMLDSFDFVAVLVGEHFNDIEKCAHGYGFTF